MLGGGGGGGVRELYLKERNCLSDNTPKLFETITLNKYGVIRSLQWAGYNKPHTPCGIM